MLLDTCILVDVVRGRDAAQTFLRDLAAPPAISVLTVTELLFGARGARETATLEALFAVSDVLPVDDEIARLGATYLKRFKASHGTDVVDALIAATATRHDRTLATLNLKHFPMFPNLGRPYAKG